MTGRTTNEESIVRKTEAVSPQIYIGWNPVDDSGSVQFMLRDMVYENGEYVGLSDHKRLNTNGLGAFSVSIPEIAVTSFPGRDGQAHQGTEILMLIKDYFDYKFTKLLEQQEQMEQELAEAAEQGADEGSIPEPVIE
jgi:hypothetical protein